MRTLLFGLALLGAAPAFAQGYQPQAVGKPAFNASGILQQPLSDGTTATADSGVSAVSQTASAVKAAIGATTSNGHTTTPITMSFTTVAVGGTPFTITGVADPASGFAPGVGAICNVGTNTATPLPTTLRLLCTVTASGTVQVMAIPIAGVALGAQSFTANVFWWW